jgi:hypothetical protein
MMLILLLASPVMAALGFYLPFRTLSQRAAGIAAACLGLLMPLHAVAGFCWVGPWIFDHSSACALRHDTFEGGCGYGEFIFITIIAVAQPAVATLIGGALLFAIGRGRRR